MSHHSACLLQSSSLPVACHEHFLESQTRIEWAEAGICLNLPRPVHEYLKALMCDENHLIISFLIQVTNLQIRLKVYDDSNTYCIYTLFYVLS